MRCYLYEGERLVFEGEGWGIIIDDGESRRTYCEGYVYGTHQACTDAWLGQEKDEEKQNDPECGTYYSYGENCWEPEHSDPKVRPVTHTPAVCCICNKPVPEGVQALILMEQWTRR